MVIFCKMPPFPRSSMKLLVDTATQRVLFAEADKDVVDFILGLVAMPLGAVDRLLHPEGGPVGSIRNVYASAKQMDAAYMESTAARNALLVAPPPSNTRTTSDSKYDELPQLYLYRCDSCQASPLPEGTRGFVKDIAKYNITDDLTITPATTNVSSVAMLKSLGVKDLDALHERTVFVGHEQAVDILKAAMSSKTVLTDAFMMKKSKRERESTVSHCRNGTGTRRNKA